MSIGIIIFAVLVIILLAFMLSSVIALPVFLTMDKKKRENDKEEQKQSLIQEYLDKGAIKLKDAYDVVVYNSPYDVKELSALIKDMIDSCEAEYQVKQTIEEKRIGKRDLRVQAKKLIIHFVEGENFDSLQRNREPFPEGHKYSFKVAGQYVSGQVCFVALLGDPPKEAPVTALLHEMMHWVHDVKFDNPDADHADSDQLGDTWTEDTNMFIYEVQKRHMKEQ